MASKSLLVVEDEPAIAESLAYALRRAGYEPIVSSTFAQAWENRKDVALIVLDLMLPDGSGFDLITSMRREGDSTPIIVLSSRDGEADRVTALDSGADDYVTKPFSPREVVARIGAVLRRHELSPGAAAGDGAPLQLDPARRAASYRGATLDLTRVEFDLLGALMDEPGHVQSRPQLITRVWGDGFAITDRTIDSHIKSLRRKLSDAGAASDLIATVRGVGYRISET